jgi:hypothetical protein
VEFDNFIFNGLVVVPETSGFGALTAMGLGLFVLARRIKRSRST